MANRLKLPAEEDILEEARAALEACLADVPFCRITFDPPQSSVDDRGIDFSGRFILPDRPVTFAVEAKRIGQPRFAREAVYGLLRYRSRNPDVYGIFVAPFVADEAAKILEAEDMGYVDLSGNCRLCFDRVYVSRTGSENRFARRRDLRSLFSPKSERVLRVLFTDPARSWKVQDLAKEAKVSLGQVSNVTRNLENREWVLRGETGIRLSKPDRLLSEWKDNYDLARSQRRDYFTLDRLDRFEARLAEQMSRTRRDYALTGFSAAARFAPAVRYQRVHAYITDAPERVAQQLEIKPVESGANVTLIEPYDEGVYLGAADKGGVTVVSPVQGYLDLSQLRGRGEEAAEALLREVIRPSWQ
jgi:Transcriptional regulator, AbiEi antitoxin, Type IV TA system